LLRTAIIAVVLALAGAAWAASPGDQRRAELLHLLKHDCGSCHGMTMKGGLGPPLVPEALMHRDHESLVEVIVNGNPGTPMAPWGPLLREGEADWLARTLREGINDAP
jgi:cytochrome c55X